VRVVIADDSALTREGIAGFLRRAAIDVAAQASSPDELLRAVEEHRPDVAIVDIRMPPTYTDEGLRAAQAIRTRDPRIGILILSQHVETGTATRLLTAHPEGSDTCSKIGSATSRSSRTRWSGSPPAAPSSTRRSSPGCSGRPAPTDGSRRSAPASARSSG
jgi:DNA-binding NarL/FixJ family response regulator